MPSTTRAKTERFEEGRRVVVKSHFLADVRKTRGSNVYVTSVNGVDSLYQRKHIKKWPVMDIPHPLPVNSVVTVIPPGDWRGVDATVRLTGSDGDGLIYRVASSRFDLIEVGPEAIIDVESVPDDSSSHGH